MALAARLHEPHIIPIHDYGEIDDQLYLDMRLVEGPDLATLLRREGALAAGRAVGIVAQVAAALDAAHATGLVHRDIKPGNILITRPDPGGSAGSGDEFVYVADFGIARATDGSTSASLTDTGTAVGSLDYVAPERFGASHGDHLADVYALGCVLHEALTARRPFPVQGLPALVNAHLSTPPPAPSALRAGLPAGLDAVVARAMAKDPDHRYPSAGALVADARAALHGAPVAAAGALAAVPAPVAGQAPPAGPPPVPAGSPAGSGPRRGRLLTVLAVVATVLVLSGALVATQIVKPTAAGSAVGGDHVLARPPADPAPASPAPTTAPAPAQAPVFLAADDPDPTTVTVGVPVPGDPPDPATVTVGVPVPVPGPPAEIPGPVRGLASTAHNDGGTFHVETS